VTAPDRTRELTDALHLLWGYIHGYSQHEGESRTCLRDICADARKALHPDDAQPEPWPLSVACPKCAAPERVWCETEWNAREGSGSRVGHVHDERRAATRAGVQPGTDQPGSAVADQPQQAGQAIPSRSDPADREVPR
jgi:hypothetical protein